LPCYCCRVSGSLLRHNRHCTALAAGCCRSPPGSHSATRLLLSSCLPCYPKLPPGPKRAALRPYPFSPDGSRAHVSSVTGWWGRGAGLRPRDLLTVEGRLATFRTWRAAGGRKTLTPLALARAGFYRQARAGAQFAFECYTPGVLGLLGGSSKSAFAVGWIGALRWICVSWKFVGWYMGG
jgi:hypothetical protein